MWIRFKHLIRKKAERATQTEFVSQSFTSISKITVPTVAETVKTSLVSVEKEVQDYCSRESIGIPTISELVLLHEDIVVKTDWWDYSDDVLMELFKQDYE